MKVDASRRRNDPRKLNKVLMSMVRLRSKTYQPIKAERVSSERLTPGSESSSRRVWGQRPGQLVVSKEGCSIQSSFYKKLEQSFSV